jgi:protein-tyrosine phosphatase
VTGDPGKILLVCTGNLCRSAFAAAHLKALARARQVDLDIRSRGLGAASGCSPPLETQTVARSYGLDLKDHRGTQIETEDITWADEILVMEPWQEEGLRRLAPAARITGLWTCLPGTSEIPDPYSGGLEDHEQAASLLDQALKAWLDQRV